MRGRTYKNYTGEPLYPFGYGLSYADISLGGLRADRARAVVSAVNHSASAAEEVVEVYVRDMGSPDAPVNPVLGGFSRVRLEAGKTEELAIPLDPRAFTVVGDDGCRRPGIGPWFVYAGFGQPDPITEKLTGRSCLRTEIVP